MTRHFDGSRERDPRPLKIRLIEARKRFQEKRGEFSESRADDTTTLNDKFLGWPATKEVIKIAKESGKAVFLARMDEAISKCDSYSFSQAIDNIVNTL